jgi:hypothetical protein
MVGAEGGRQELPVQEPLLLFVVVVVEGAHCGDEELVEGVTVMG